MTAPSLSINPERLIALLRDMVNLYSPSGKEEEIADFLTEYMEANGLKVQRQPVDENRSNLLVYSGNSSPDTLLLGHMDTVPAFDIEHYGYSERGDVACGLGTADMKGGCAAMIESFITAAHAKRLSDRTMLAIVVGEEESGDGTAMLLKHYSFANAIVGEPTELNPCLAHFGYIEMLIRAFGYRRHAAVSDRANNAIRAMLRLLLDLEDRVEQDSTNMVLNIRDLHSSESGFAVPDRCAASVDVHIPPDVNARSYSDSLRLFAESELDISKASRFEVEFPTLADGYSLPSESEFSHKLQRVFADLARPWTPQPFRSHSDANLLMSANCSPVILGPGQLAKAHTRDESVSLSQVLSAAQIYTRYIAE